MVGEDHKISRRTGELELCGCNVVVAEQEGPAQHFRCTITNPDCGYAAVGTILGCNTFFIYRITQIKFRSLTLAERNVSFRC
jgi:hypothetical protein